MLEQGQGESKKGGGIGLVVGLFAPPLLLWTAIGAGIGAVLGHFTKKHDEKELGVDLDEYFPPNSSAVVVVDDKYLDRVQAALTTGSKSIRKAIDEDDFDKLQDAIAKSEKQVDAPSSPDPSTQAPENDLFDCGTADESDARAQPRWVLWRHSRARTDSRVRREIYRSALPHSSPGQGESEPSEVPAESEPSSLPSARSSGVS